MTVLESDLAKNVNYTTGKGSLLAIIKTYPVMGAF